MICIRLNQHRYYWIRFTPDSYPKINSFALQILRKSKTPTTNWHKITEYWAQFSVSMFRFFLARFWANIATPKHFCVLLFLIKILLCTQKWNIIFTWDEWDWMLFQRRHVPSLRVKLILLSRKTRFQFKIAIHQRYPMIFTFPKCSKVNDTQNGNVMGMGGIYMYGALIPQYLYLVYGIICKDSVNFDYTC